MNNYKKGDAVKWIVVFIAIILLAVFLTASITQGFTNVNPWGWFGEDEQAEAETPDVRDENGNDLTAGEVYAMPKMISFSEKALLKAAASGSGISVKINATVEPATATNKAVDWSVAWADTSNTAVVSEYVTAIPDADGSTSASVTCYQPFTGVILITVTTRESGFEAICSVTFGGKPTSLTITSSALSLNNDAYYLGIGGTYDFNVTPINPFNEVGSKYNNFTCTVTGVGSLVLGYMEHSNVSGNDRWITTRTVTFDSMKNNFITASYSDGTLTVTTIRSIESYYAYTERLDAGRVLGYKDKFHSYVDDCYFVVTVRENNSGVSQSINVRFDANIVANVVFDNNNLEF